MTAEVAGDIANVTDITAAFSGTITDTLANLADSGSITTNFSRARGDDTDVKVVVSDGTGTLSAADLKAVTEKTTGTVTLQNAQTVSGSGSDLVAALKTDPVTLSAASTATITSAVTAAVAAEIAAITDITLDSSGDGTITDTLENLLNDGETAISTAFSNARAEDTDVNVIISDGTGSIDAAKLSLITAKTTGTVTLQMRRPFKEQELK